MCLQAELYSRPLPINFLLHWGNSLFLPLKNSIYISQSLDCISLSFCALEEPLLIFLAESLHSFLCCRHTFLAKRYSLAKQGRRASVLLLKHASRPTATTNLPSTYTITFQALLTYFFWTVGCFWIVRSSDIALSASPHFIIDFVCVYFFGELKIATSPLQGDLVQLKSKSKQARSHQVSF